MDFSAVMHVLRSQDGVFSRAQALECGLDDNDLERHLRRRRLARVHPGVFVDHTGIPTWSQRAWAAVLFHWPAALAGPSALRAHGLRSANGGELSSGFERWRPRLEPSAQDPIHVVVSASRRLRPPPGVAITRRTDFESQVQMHLSPPRLRLEEALLDVASSSGREADAVALLADACQEGATTAARLHETLSGRARLSRRRLLLSILDDVATGSMSVFERRYLHEVERAHGLPTARRQVRRVMRHGVTFRDVEHSDFGVVVELDGRLAHAGPRRWTDLERDVEAAVRGEATVRFGWLHIFEPCRAGGAVGRLLRSRGWTGSVTACGPGCTAVESSQRGAA
ncbi:type IV toxin-antitoxin system AbiEi family antitoxin domain-containing protein [Terrabacter carboxydivorans]|uniref:AbiEi antitoxin N-terminal domain-containing protein n=1 Tax=Terrabacter carboxydivorans TaxID=619730 RepID=A0ABP5XYB6_9MICO